MPTLDDLPTPALLIDQARLTANLHAMQAACDAQGVELRPHVKTHKLVPIARQQLALGAAGLTCAKLGEAEAMLPSGVRSLFLAHSLVDPRQAPCLAALAERIADLRLAVTSEVQAEALAALAARVGRTFAVMMAVDTGLGREGARDLPAAQRLAATVARSRYLELRGFTTHEGHFYTLPAAEHAASAEEMIARLAAVRDAIDQALPIWPGCSVTARRVIATGAGRVQAVRPGAYVFGDLYLTQVTATMAAEAVALQVLATVVDLPEPGLALIDAGSKTFSSDRTAEGTFAAAADGRAIQVVRVNEEHGYLRGADVTKLRVGDRLAFVPAHVCPVVNLASQVTLRQGDVLLDTWRVDARGCTQ